MPEAERTPPIDTAGRLEGTVMDRQQRNLSPMKTVRTFLAKGTCSQTLACVLNRAFEHPLGEEERASDPLAGGILQHGYQCGMIWGSVLAAGAEIYRRCGAGPRAEAKAIRAAQRIMDSFRTQNKETDCVEITGIQETSTPWQMTKYFLLQGGTVGCFRMAVRYAPVAHREIEAAISGDDAGTPAAPVSCAAELARKMGASEMHTVMVAGFAGGIGLSGGACGALGAAIWLRQLKALQEGGKPGYKSAEVQDIIARFVKCTGCEFECSKIAGQKFENAASHAAYVSNGGCSKIMGVLEQ